MQVGRKGVPCKYWLDRSGVDRNLGLDRPLGDPMRIPRDAGSLRAGGAAEGCLYPKSQTRCEEC